MQVLLSLAKQLKPHVWLNVHSGMYALFTPYDHKGHVPNTTGELWHETPLSAARARRSNVLPFSSWQRCCFRSVAAWICAKG